MSRAHDLAQTVRQRMYVSGSEDALTALAELERLAADADSLKDEVAAYSASIVEHHNINNLSDAAITESLGWTCQICARAQSARRAALEASA